MNLDSVALSRGRMEGRKRQQREGGPTTLCGIHAVYFLTSPKSETFVSLDTLTDNRIDKLATFPHYHLNYS